MAATDEKALPDDVINVEDVKRAVKNSVADVLEQEGDHAITYEHTKAADFITRICELTVERCVKLKKPYKFVCTALIARKAGAGVYICSSAHFSPSDGYVCEAPDLSESLYCAVTLFWCAL